MRSLSCFVSALLISLTWLSLASAQTVESAVVDTVDEQLPEIVNILPDNAILLGEAEDNGVLAIAYLYKTPFTEIASGQEPELPFILFLRFLGVENNILIEKGLVAYKIEDENGDKRPAMKMELKKGYFVAGLEPPGKGRYILHVGCKLEDEKKRQYQYELIIR